MTEQKPLYESLSDAIIAARRHHLNVPERGQ